MPEKLLEPITGLSESRLKAATAAASNVLEGKTFYAGDKSLKAGSMSYNGAWTGSVAPGGSITIPAGYHNGSGKVTSSGSSIKSNGYIRGYTNLTSMHASQSTSVSNNSIKYALILSFANNGGEASTVSGSNISTIANLNNYVRNTVGCVLVKITGYPASITMYNKNTAETFYCILGLTD